MSLEQIQFLKKKKRTDHKLDHQFIHSPKGLLGISVQFLINAII